MNEVENYQFNESKLSRDIENAEKGKNSGAKKNSLVKKIGRCIARIVGVLAIVFLVLGIGSHFLKSNSNNGDEQTYEGSNAYQSPTKVSSTVSAEDEKEEAIAILKSMAESFEPMTIEYTNTMSLEFSPEEKCIRYNCEFINMGKDRLRKVEKLYEGNEMLFKEKNLYHFIILPDSTKELLLNVLEQAGYALAYRLNFSSEKSIETVLTPAEIRQAEMTLSRETIYKKLIAIQCMLDNIDAPYYVDEETGIKIHIEESQLNKMSRKYGVVFGSFIEGSDLVVKISLPECDGYDVESMGEYMTNDVKKEMIKSLCNPSSDWSAEEIAFSKYDLVFQYRGARSGEVCDVRFPNSMILCEVLRMKKIAQ